jgi:endonuclease/exonuclease/phosphatase family metal-dependent hydrolase
MTRTLRTAVAAAATAAFLVSTSGTATQAMAPTPSAPSAGTVRVATYNVAKSTLRKGKWSWTNRRVKLVRAVAAADPDVLLVQEANTQKWHGIRHIDDVVGLLGSVGYQIASTNYDACTEGCTRGAHVFFKPSRMHIASLPNPAAAVGMTGLSVIARTWAPGVQDRAVSWAFLTPHGSDRIALYISVHMPTDKDATGEALRVAIAQQLRGWADSLIQYAGLPGADIVIGGDLNSYAKRQPYGAQAILAASGLIDGWNAPEKVNAHYGTVNYTPKTKKYKGFPPRPYFYTYEPTRIDYVFSTATPVRHEVVLGLTSKGKFDNNFRASDHNMVMVDLLLR